MRHQHHVGLRACGADVRAHRVQVRLVRPGVDARRRARLVVLDLLVERVRAHRRATGPARLGPVGLGQDRGIGEEGHARAVGQCPDDRLPRGGDVRARADHRDAGVLEMTQSLEEGVVAPVQAVIAGEGQHVEAGARDGGGAFRFCHHGVPRLGHARAARRETGLELAEHQLGLSQRGRGRREAAVRVLAIGCKVAGRQHDPAGHGVSPAGAGSPAQLPGRAPQARSCASG